MKGRFKYEAQNEAGMVLFTAHTEDEVRQKIDNLIGYTKVHLYVHVGTFDVKPQPNVYRFKRRTR